MQTLKETTVSLESIDRFRSWLYVRGRSENTARAYTADLRMFLKAATTTDHSMILMKDFEDTAAYWLTRERRTVAIKTTGRRLTSLRAFAKWAGWGEVLEDYDVPTPAKSVPHPLPEGMQGVRRLIIVSSNEQQRSLIVLCGMVGCRVAEALAVRSEHFNLQNKTLTIRGKGDKERVVPVSTEAWEYLQIPMLRAFADGTTIVRLHDRHARKVITTLGARAGLKRSISSHDLRATFGTEVYNKTKDIRIVQELLGHASSNTTEIYLGIKQEALRAAVEL